MRNTNMKKLGSSKFDGGKDSGALYFCALCVGSAVVWRSIG